MPENDSHLDRHIDVFFGEVGEALGRDENGIRGTGFGGGFSRGISLERASTKEKVTIQIGSDPDGQNMLRVWHTTGKAGDEGTNTYFPTNTLPSILAGFMMSRFRRMVCA